MNIRVLHIELGRHLYGGAKQVTYLVHALDKDSAYQQHLLCTEDSEISKVSFNRCTTHTIRYRGDTDLMGFKRMLNKVKQISPDIIHVEGPIFGVPLPQSLPAFPQYVLVEWTTLKVGLRIINTGNTMQ